MKGNQRDGVYIKIADEAEIANKNRLELLYRTLSADDCRLAAIVHELDYCVNTSEMKFFLSITSTCKSVTHLYLRGPEGRNSSFEAAAIK